jgi:hypothetical protein
MNNFSEKISFDGRVTIYNSIPKYLYSEEQLDRLQRSNPGINVRSFVDDPTKMVKSKNMVLDAGKKEILDMAFRQPDIPGVESLCFGRIAIGDGGYDFASGTRLYPELTNTSLAHQVGNPILITSFQPVAGDSINGWTKVIAATFFGTNYGPSDFQFQNQTDFYVNETAILDQNDVPFCRLTFNNFPFDPVDNLALTINWHIKVR